MNNYFITTDRKFKSDFKNCLLNPIPNNDAIWFPYNIQPFEKTFFDNIEELTFQDLSLKILKRILKDEISDKDLKEIIKDSFNFPIPLVNHENIFVLELFHGPTFTFKDVGSRFMSRILKHYFKKDDFDIIVSTSGDTGGAVADAFKDLENVKVHILYPKNKISVIQEKQLTTYGNNVFAYCVEGNFDDCQKLIKDTLKDKNINKRLKFFPANSISIARLIPQCLYYFWAYAQHKKISNNKELIVCVPSGNLGNLTGGILAKLLGLPIKKFIGATNLNNTFERYLNGKDIRNIKAKETLSSAMDIGIPNNLKRLIHVFENEINMNKLISSYSFNDDETIKGIIDFYNKYEYVIDPHTSVGYRAILEDNCKGADYILVSTAHPGKFFKTMDKTNIPYQMPQMMKNLLELKESKIDLKNDYSLWIKKLIKNSTQSITFVGMPFSGKSYIGNKIANYLNYKFIDFDKEIEKKYNQNLGDIVEEKSNDEFKKIEEDIVVQYLINNSKKENMKHVFSPGGSIIYCEQAMEILSKNSIIIYLDIPLEILENRFELFKKINPNSRGIVFKEGMEYKDLYKERKPTYESYYDIKIKEIDESKILEIIKNI